MAQKLATVSTVFAACDRLDAANERWNREDVRNEVGGGGYVVIDPLIRAWRELKPLREQAPSTPTELLYQVAASLETHLTGFMGEAEERLTDSQKVFDATVSELSEKLANLEVELAEKEASFEAAEASNVELTSRLERVQEELNEARSENSRLQAENDGLNGQVARMEKEHKSAINAMQGENRELIKQHAAERSRLSDEHSAALVDQRKELTESAEQAENRLMVLLDQERQEAKSNQEKLSGDLEKMTQKSQAARESLVALETTVKELTRQNEKLESDLSIQVESNSTLKISLEDQRIETDSVLQEFSAYKEEHRLSGDLSALQDAVAGLQAQIIEQRAAQKE